MPNIRQRRQTISAALAQKGHQTIRAIAAATGISKSSVQRHAQVLRRQHQQFPESPLWVTATGEQWLKRLVIATIYEFGLKRGVGAESLCEFFHKLRLEGHIGVSVSSLRKIQGVLEEKILAYKEIQHEQLSQSSTYLPTLCVGIDETWFEHTILVMMDLSSGYLLVEEMASDHRYGTWRQPVQKVLEQWRGQIQYCVNDRAKALIKLALNDLGCPSIADLFHAMRKLTQGLGLDLDHRLHHLQRRLREWQAQPTKEATLGETLQSEVDGLQSAQSEFREHLMHISLGLHPFDVSTLCAQTAQKVSAKLNEQVNRLKEFKQTQKLKDAPGGIEKFTRQIDDLSAVVDVWWWWVYQSLTEHPPSEALIPWIITVLLPCCYWRSQTQRTNKPALRAYYQDAYQRAQLALHTHPITSTLQDDTYSDWESWARDMVTKFQRTTAAVEGRNGYLTQVHHNCRGLSARRLYVMTVIHNFDLQRADGSTAAERLFKQPHPNLFETILTQIPDLPLPRRRSKASTVANPC